MKIFYDPTESRAGTKLPANVIDAGSPIQGLEEWTGGDILISPLNSSLPSPLIRGCKPHEIALAKHTEAGLIVQRKSGNDFIGSIVKLNDIQGRMQQWGMGWLLITGDLGCMRDGDDYKVVMDGRRSQWSYWSMVGALDYWQMRGGGITFLESDVFIGKWVSDMAKRVADIHANRVKLLEPRKVRQMFTARGEDEDTAVKELGTQVLMSFPGIGYKTARGIIESYGNLARSLCEISSPLVLKSEGKPAGVGKELVGTVRHVLGFGDEAKGELIPDDCFYQLRPLLTPNNKWLKHRREEFEKNLRQNVPELTDETGKIVTEIFMSYYVTFLSVGC